MISQILRAFSLTVLCFTLAACGGGSTERSASSAGKARVRLQVGAPWSGELGVLDERCDVRSLRLHDSPAPGSQVAATPGVDVVAQARDFVPGTNPNDEVIFARPLEIEVNRGGPRRFFVSGAAKACTEADKYFQIFGVSQPVEINGPTDVVIDARVSQASLLAENSTCGGGSGGQLQCVDFQFTGFGSANSYSVKLLNPSGDVLTPIPTASPTPSSTVSVKNLLVGAPVMLQFEWLSSSSQCLFRYRTPVITPTSGSANVESPVSVSSYTCS